MKLATFLLLINFSCIAATGYAQSEKVTIQLENATMKDFFSMIENQTDYKFLYRDDAVENIKVNLNESDIPLDIILNKLLDGSEFGYKILANNLIAIAPIKVFQQIKITGTVTDAEGFPLTGVTVVIEGSNIGSITDINGKYTIETSDAEGTLTFSYIGYNTIKTAIDGRSTVDVVMELDVKSLEEVVVIGYGTQKKRDISTSISSVSMENLKDKPVASFTQAIARQMAGVRILNNNNAPGGGTNIIIRGVTSINASNNPLIVIDGFPLKDGFDLNENPLNAINTADIESVEVLKDASSSAIYGAQAANGVIIITTKKGRSGKPTISINVNRGIEQMINPMDVLNRADFLQFMDNARAQAYIVEDPNFGTNDPNAPLWQWTDDNATRLANMRQYSSLKGPMATNPLYERWFIVTDETKAQPYDTDWQKAATEIGKVNDFQLSTTGGTDNLKYMISAGYYDQTGIQSATGYQRFSFRANVELQVNKWLKTGLLLAPTLENTDVMGGLEGTFFNAVALAPLHSPYDANGDPTYVGQIIGDWTEWNLEYFVNPLSNDLIKDNRRTAKNLSTIFAEINIVKDLKFRSEFHTEFRNWERSYFLPTAYPRSVGTTSRSSGLNNIDSRLYWNSQNFLTYNHLFGKHSVNGVIGYSAEESSYRSTYISKYDYASDLIPTLNQAITISDSQSDARTNRYSESAIGSFARFMYNYDGKYYMTGSIRRDGSSKFGADNKWGIFPSLSAAWRVSDEAFFSPLKQYVNDLKIRGGWGIIGNSGIGNYNALSTLGATSYILGSGSGVSAGYADQRVANSKLGWESTTDYGIGIDAEILKSRVSLSVDYFYRLTEDMLFSIPLPTITGFNSYMVNIGSMRNRGFEYMLKTHNFTGDFTWTTSYNLSYYKNRVLNTGKDKRPLISNNSYTVEGKPLAGLWGFDYLGPYSDWEDVKTNPIVNANNPSWRYRSSPGTEKMFDVNGDGIINNSDNTIIGSPNPDFIWGITNNLAYKGFDLTIDVSGVQGGDKLLTSMESVITNNRGAQNTIYEYYNDCWLPTRTDAKYAVPNRKSYDGTSARGTLLFKGTYVNFQNIVLGYTLPQNMRQKINLNQVRFYMSIRNALLITKYPGYNPEVNASGSSALSQGVDAGAYPLTRIVSFGINVTI
jgi:TonB-linked SusC/RagA family outer membrane protein